MCTSVTIPDGLLTSFGETWQAEGLESRSRGVREAMREYVEAHTHLEEIEGDVVVALAFDYEHDAVIEDVHALQHQFQDVIIAANHVHRGEWCLETVFCRGAASRVRRLTYRLRDFDAVSQVNLLFLDDG